MFSVTFGPFEAPLIAILIVGFAIAVYIDEKLRKRKYLEKSNDRQSQ